MSFTSAQLEQLRSVIQAGISEGTRDVADRVQQIELSVTEIRGQLKTGDGRMTQLGKDLAANSASTQEIRDIFETTKRGLRFLGSLGSVLKWLAGIAAIGASLWSTFKGHK